MLGDEHGAALADAEQAAYFRGYLERERDGLAADLKQLTRSTTHGAIADARRVGRAVRSVEGQLRGIDRMVEALDRRFPELPVSHEFRKLTPCDLLVPLWQEATPARAVTSIRRDTA